MIIEKCAYNWESERFNFIPTSVIIRLGQIDPNVFDYDSRLFQIIGIDVEENPPSTFPCSHIWLYNPKEAYDEEWIRAHINQVVDCGFVVFDSEDFGILLGIDGGGYNLIKAHWIPLYLARGLEWHLEEDV